MKKNDTYPTLEEWLNDETPSSDLNEELFHATAPAPFKEATESDWQVFEARRKRSNNHRRIRTRYHRLQYLTAACVVLLIGFFSYLQWTSNEIHVTGVGEQEVVTLSDGSEVMLFPNSRIEMEHGYGSDHRVIALTGQAKFKVQCGNSPFTVKTKRSEVEAVGTDFTVFDYPDITYYSVQITEGVVEVRTDTAIMLHEGSSLTIVEDRLEVEPLSSAHKTVTIIGSPTDITNLLEKYFMIDVEIDARIPSESYRFSMDPNKQQTSLETLAELVQGKLQKTENGYSIIP